MKPEKDFMAAPSIIAYRSFTQADTKPSRRHKSLHESISYKIRDDQTKSSSTQHDRRRSLAVNGKHKSIEDMIGIYNQESQQFKSNLQDLKHKLKNLRLSPAEQV